MNRSTFVAAIAGLPLLGAGANDRPATIRMPFELLAGGIYLPALVDGKGPFSFAVDTGAVNSIVASEFVSELGLTTRGVARVAGEGADAISASRIDRVAFGLPQNVVVTTREAVSVSTAELWPLIGRPFYGDIGYDVLRNFVVEIDYANRVVAFHDPQHYRYSGNGTTYDASFWRGYDPQIEGALVVAGRAPMPVTCTLDTGGSGTIVAAPVVDDNHLIEAAGATIASPSHGIGNGASRNVLARLSALHVGSYALEAPVVELSRDRIGSFASRSISVDVGGRVLRRFTVIIDYAGARVTLEPNRYFAEPFASDASGLVLAAEGADYRTFVVTEVVPGSAGALAGIDAGDAIVEIDAVSTAVFALWELRGRLERAGTPVALTIRRGSATLTRTLALRALL